MYARIVISNIFPNFNHKFNILNMTKKKLNRLKLVLVEKDKTGVWLAEQLGVTAVTVSKWCSNITQPTLPTLDRIAELLECEKRELITE
jgi:DNA-binding Xre family transcriptional regulator